MSRQQERVILLNQGSFHVIDSAIIGYTAILKTRSPVPSDRIQRLQSIRLKLAPLLKVDGFPEGTTLPLPDNEIKLIEEAIRGFKGKVRQIIQPSTKQDVALQELDRLHQYIRGYLVRDMH